MERLQGIYKITNISNNKIYIGSSINLERRMDGHKRNLKNNSHPNNHLQSSWNKYGEGTFIFEIIEIVQNTDILLTREQYWMDKYNSYDKSNGYNNSPTAGNCLGMKHSDETKNKISALRKGSVLSEETKKKISIKSSGENNGFYGMKHTEENRLKMGNRNMTMDDKEKLSKLRRGEGSPTAKLTEEEVKEIKYKIYYGSISEKDLAIEYNVSDITISRIRRGKTWSFITVEFPLYEINREKEYRESLKGEGSVFSKLNNEQVIQIKQMLAEGIKQKEIAGEFGVSPATIGNIKRGKTWTHI